jgi:hypothetical protein
MADQPRDAGKTSGGGNLGHDQPHDVADQTPIRNHPPSHDDAHGRRRDEGESDPVMPSDDSTLRTKI